MAASNIKCPEGHTAIWKKGTVPTRKGHKVRYVCSICARSFYAPEKTIVRKTRAKKAKNA